MSEVRAELRVHTQGLNALRETQLEQGREIITSGKTWSSWDGRCVRVSPLATGMAQITALLTNLTESARDGSWALPSHGEFLPEVEHQVAAIGS